VVGRVKAAHKEAKEFDELIVTISIERDFKLYVTEINPRCENGSLENFCVGFILNR